MVSVLAIGGAVLAGVYFRVTESRRKVMFIPLERKLYASTLINR